MTRWMAAPLLGGLVAACLAAAAQAQTAAATLAPTAGNTTSGTVTFTQKGNKAIVIAKITGLTPGAHSLHLHAKGDCSAPDGMSAGGHFNPTGRPHGEPNSPDHHAGGDVPMLQADVAGNATLRAELAMITIGSGATDIVGKSVIIHNKPVVAHKDVDDLKAQPSADSGARVACGIIKKT